MKKEILDFIKENNLSPFEEKKQIRPNSISIFKTTDAKSVYNRVLNKVFENFEFENSSVILSLFGFIENESEIKRRQGFFLSLKKQNREFLKRLMKPKLSWKPKYNVVVVTENEDTFMELKKMECPVQYISTENDLADLENCEIIQVLDCQNFSSYLERLPQTIFINSVDEAYLERYLEILSGWKINIEVLEKEKFDLEACEIVNEIRPLLKLIENEEKKKITKPEIEEEISGINEKISDKIKGMTLSGDLFFDIVSKNKIPKEIEDIAKKAIEESGLPRYLFNLSIPVSMDEKETENFLKRQDSEEFASSAESIKRNSRLLISLPDKLRKLEELILCFDFVSGIYDFFESSRCINPIEICGELCIDNSKNIFIDRAQPISFYLDSEKKCSILTGANSGGKTTLLEHIIQLISLLNLGFPASGKVSLPIFSEVYYFAKNKGSVNKGAFETLLTQMSQIKSGKKTLILADEIESVTEPGVAGHIISATCEYFIKKGCFLVVATHLGQEIQKTIPSGARIDGIEAKGLDESFELIVDHNPVLGRLANSTPELIVEKMAGIHRLDYFVYINNYLKNNKLKIV
jgi:hypothetical protein